MTLPASRTHFSVWDLPLRLFHWLLVASIAVAFLSSEEDSALAGWHIAAGWVAAVLIAFRLAWGFVGGEHARFANFIRPTRALAHFRDLASGQTERTVGHNPAGGLAVLVLLGGIAAVILTGWTAFQGGEEDLHEGIAWALLGFIGIHVAAVIATSVLSRENLARAMVTGKKASADHPHAQPARAASPTGILLALALTAATVAGIRTLDAQAFNVHQREGGEREAGEGGEGSGASEEGESEEHEGEDDRD